MKIPGRGFAFVKHLNEAHGRISLQLRDQLHKIEIVYSDSIRQLNENICKGMGVGTGFGSGLGSIFFGTFFPRAEIGTWFLGAALGAIFGCATGFVTSGVITKVDADNHYLESLRRLFEQEVNFVLGQQNALASRIRQSDIRSEEYRVCCVTL